MPRYARLPRRSFLRGVGGVALGLPALQMMVPSGSVRAGGDVGAPRFLTSYVGTSTGRGHYVDDVCCGPVVGGDRITPGTAGPGYEVTQALAPVGAVPWRYLSEAGGDQPAYDIRDELTVVSGLTVPTGMSGAIPAAGRHVAFHGTSVTPQLAGCKAPGRGSPATTPTVDQLVAEAIGRDPTFPTLAYRVEVTDYYSGNSNANMAAMSWKRDGQGGVIRVDPVVNPQLAWETLFTGFTPPDPAEAAELAFELNKRRTVLDLVGDSAKDLARKLGREDKLRMEQHFDEIWSLEQRLAEVNVPTSPLCERLPDPGEIPIGGAGQDVETETNKWSDEELRAEVLSDLIYMAFVCELTYSASLMFEHWKSYLNMYPAIGQLQDLHDITHFGGSGTGVGPQGDTLAWHIKHFARLARRLKDAPEPDGVAVLDRTVLAMVFEGGWGFDPEAGSEFSPHSTENMIVLVAGGRELGLNPGRHVRGDGAHPAAVLLAGAQACGLDEPLGEVTQPFADL